MGRLSRFLNRFLVVEPLEARILLAGDITLIRHFDTWDGGVIRSSDPAGLAFHSPSGNLYISDSEINEIASFEGENVFETSLSGDTLARAIATNNDEPTGITYYAGNDSFYVTNDNTYEITRYDATFATPLASIATNVAVPGAIDPEGITVDPATGLLYVADGNGGGIQVLVYNADLEYQSRFAVGNLVADPEGIAFNPDNGHLYLVSSPDLAIFEFTTEGEFIAEYDISGFSPTPLAPQGLTFAPTSDLTDDPSRLAVYIADGMIDNFEDGRIYEALITPPSSGTLIGLGSTWKYLDDGSDQGTAWRGIGFDDAAWSTAAAQLGYGDGDEATVIDFGPQPENKFVTTYFRRDFDVADPGGIAALELGLIRDDGAVVYLNGQEVFRSNLPTGTISATTLASSAIIGAAESELQWASIDASLLVAGTNTLAVEIHQATADSSDLSFDLELTVAAADPVLIGLGSTWKYLDDGSDQGVGWQATDFNDTTWSEGAAQLGYGDGDETTVVNFGPQSASKYITTYFRHSFDVAQPEDISALRLGLIRDDGAVVYLNGQEVFRSNLPSGAISSTTLATTAVIGGAESQLQQVNLGSELLVAGVNTLAVEIHQATPDSSDLSFDLELIAIPQDPILISLGSTWSYLDDGSNQGTAWRTLEFDDSSWNSAAAELGYGDGDETTLVNFGPQANNKYVTTYFRHTFDVADPNSIGALNLGLLRDDGAVVYLNGQEVFRSNLPGGPISFTTLASTAVFGVAENQLQRAVLSPSLLVAGSNVVAVEVHQATADSSDISFDLELITTSSVQLQAAGPSYQAARTGVSAAAARGRDLLYASWQNAEGQQTASFQRSQREEFVIQPVGVESRHRDSTVGVALLAGGSGRHSGPRVTTADAADETGDSPMLAAIDRVLSSFSRSQRPTR